MCVIILFCTLFLLLLLFRFLNYFYREGKEGRKRGRETSMCGCLSCTPTGDPACNPGMCPDWESNWQPFGLQAHAQSTELHKPGLFLLFLKLWITYWKRTPRVHQDLRSPRTLKVEQTFRQGCFPHTPPVGPWLSHLLILLILLVVLIVGVFVVYIWY